MKNHAPPQSKIDPGLLQMNLEDVLIASEHRKTCVIVGGIETNAGGTGKGKRGKTH